MFHLPFVEARSGVEESSLESRDWDASFDGDVLVGKRPGLVQADTVRPAVPGDASHLDRLPRPSYPPEMRRAPVREDGIGAAGKDGCHPLSIAPDAPMAQCEDSTVDWQ
jgi:hypothetical protein